MLYLASCYIFQTNFNSIAYRYYFKYISGVALESTNSIPRLNIDISTVGGLKTYYAHVLTLKFYVILLECSIFKSISPCYRLKF